MFDQTLGFSNGCAELALKKPPPLSPISLMASWPATGPRAMICFAPSSVVASTEALSVCGTPSAAKASATTIDSGRSRSAGVVGDGVVALAEMPQLRFAAPEVAGEFVHEYDGHAGACLLVIEFHPIIGGGVRHANLRLSRSTLE